MTLAGENIYSGGTVVTGGTIRLDVDNALPTTQPVQMGNASRGSSILDLNGHNQTLAGLFTDEGSSPDGTFWDEVTNASETPAKLTINNSIDYNYAGYLSGNLTIDKYGVGTWTVTGSNCNTGDVAIYDGILQSEGCFTSKVYTVSGSGNPQLLGNVDPSYYTIVSTLIEGEHTYTYTVTEDIAVTSPTRYAGSDWQSAIRNGFANRGSITMSNGGQTLQTLTFSTQYAFDIGTAATLASTYPGFGLLNYTYTDAQGQHTITSDTRLIVMEDETGLPWNDHDYDDAFWVVTAVLGQLSVDLDNDSVVGMPDHQDATTMSQLTVNSPGKYLSVPTVDPANTRLVPMDIKLDGLSSTSKIRFVSGNDSTITIWQNLSSTSLDAKLFYGDSMQAVNYYSFNNTYYSASDFGITNNAWYSFYVSAEHAGTATVTFQVDLTGSDPENDQWVTIDSVPFTVIDQYQTCGCSSCSSPVTINLDNQISFYPTPVTQVTHLVYTGNAVAEVTKDQVSIWDNVWTDHNATHGSFIPRQDVTFQGTLSGTLTPQNEYSALTWIDPSEGTWIFAAPTDVGHLQTYTTCGGDSTSYSYYSYNSDLLSGMTTVRGLGAPP